MSGAKSIKGIGIFLVLLLSIITASALQEQFQAYVTSPSVAACANSVTTTSLVVKNTGDIESAYSLSASGEALAFATYSETQFSVKPGESKTVFVYFSPAGRMGSYSLQTSITTALGSRQVVIQSITVQNCANIQLNVKTPALRSNPCQVSQFSFEVRNTGDYAEFYNFNVKGLEQYTTLSTDSTFLAPGQSQQIDVFVNPECSVYGEKEITFQTYAQTSQYLAEAHVALDIARTYDYSVTVPSTISICNLKESTIPVSFVNFVPFANQYDIVVKGPQWLQQTAQRVELGGYGKGASNLVAHPVNPGSYLAEIVTKSVRGDVLKGGVLNITVEKCYSSDVNIKQPADIIVAGHAATYELVVKNDGTRQDTYNFELDVPAWVSADVKTTIVKAGEEKTFKLTAQPTNVTGTFTATVKLLSEETKTFREDVLPLKVVAPEDAYELKITPTHTRVLYGEGAALVKLQNTGVLPATYSLTLQGPQWTKLSANSVTLQPGEKGSVVVATNAQESAEQANYEVAVVATVGNEVGFVSKFVIKLRQLTVSQELTVFTINYWPFIVAGVVVLIILAFLAIYGRRMIRAYRNWKLKRQELAKIRAELKAKKKEEKLAKKLLKEAQKKLQPPRQTGKKVFGIFLIILGLLVLTAIGLSIAGYFPFVQEFIKQQTPQQQFEPIIRVDTAGLEAYGNTVIIRNLEETVIPIIVKNNYDNDLLFDVEVEESWIKTDTKEVELEAGEEERINLRVIPDETTDGVYKILVSATLEQENKVFSEDITLNVKQRSLLQDIVSYLPYVVGGIIVLLLGLFLKKRSAQRKLLQPEKVELPKIKYKPVKKIEIDLPKKK
jgi:uncharacterized membrane protein